MSNMNPKIVIIGAGSLFFGRQAIWAVNFLEGLRGCTLALVDIDDSNLQRMVQLARMVAEYSGSGTKVEAYSDFRSALPGADFVVLSFSDRNAHFRRIDCEISARFGVRMCSGDTIGPGGVFRTIREFPKILEIAREVEVVCPNAWVINYVNPSATIGIGLMRHASVKSFALCDGLHLPYRKQRYLDMIGESAVPLSRFDMRIAGVNHFTWMLKAEIDGLDVLPRIAEAHRELSGEEKDEGYAKGRFNHTITAQLYDVFGAVSTCTAHAKEYVPYYQGRSPVCEEVPPLSVFDCDERDERTVSMWNEVDEYLAGSRPLEEFRANYRSDHATDIIETMVSENGRTYFVNRSNSDGVEPGCRPVENLLEDAFLEMECHFDRNGPRPLPVGSFPRGLLGQQQMILDVHELTIEAIMQGSRSLLLRALAMDPLINSIATADLLIDRLADAQREVMPEWLR